MVKSSNELIEEAEKRARIRDSIVEGNQNIDLDYIDEMEEKAKEQGYLLIKKKNSNRANFSQVIHENIEPIVRQGYLSMNELGFLIAIQPFMEYQINAIMDKDRNTFMTISDIASYLNRDRTGVSRIITTLLEKGILFEFVNIHDIKKFNRSISPRTLFVNPELFYSGDRNKVDGTLSTLVSNNDQLEKNNIKLNWKLWRKQGYSFGRLYSRKTYLKLKKSTLETLI